MGSDQVSDATVFAAALILLLSIVAKLVAANLIAKIKQDYHLLDLERKGFMAKLKQAQLASASARGTYEFWQRRLTETAQKEVSLHRGGEGGVPGHYVVPRAAGVS